MPQAIALAVVAAIGLTGTAAAIATAVVTLAITVGLSSIAKAIFGSGGTGKPSDGQRIIRLAVGSRIRHYGKVRVGGQLTFYESRDGTLYSLVTVGHGEIKNITEFLLNGEAVTVNGSGLVTDAKFKGAVSIHHRLGSDTQTAYSELTSIFTEWTTNHRQRGCSSVLVISRGVEADEFSEVYEGSREPEPQVTIKGSLCYDPRLDSTNGGSGSHRLDDEGTWQYSDNWALCFADYLAHADGYGMGTAAINWSNIADEADICDEQVDTVDARTIDRWRVAGSYKLADDERRVVVKEFLKAADGFLWQDADGLANIRSGRWIAPAVHIPEKHIIGVSASLGASPQDRANEVRVMYMEPGSEYSETEAAPLVNEASLLALGRSEVSRFDCFYCPDHNQAQRIGKRILTRLSDDRWSLTITTNLYGLNVIGERFITLSISELEIDALSFEVVALKIDPGSLNVELGLMEAREADFDFDETTEEGDPPGSVPSTAVAIVIETVANLTLSAVQIAIHGGGGVAIQATWDAPVRVGLLAQVEYREDGETDWNNMPVSQASRLATSGVISTGVEHDVRARFVTVSGRPSAWSSVETITPDADEIGPMAPTNFRADGEAAQVRLRWSNPTDPSYDHVEAFYGATDDFGSATQLGSDFTGGSGVWMDEDVAVAAGTYYFWLVSVTSTDVAGNPTASIQATVS